MECHENKVLNEEDADSIGNPEPLNLTTIPDECKICIFEYLNWPDLLSLAETNKELNKMVYLVFNRKYRKQKFSLGHALEER